MREQKIDKKWLAQLKEARAEWKRRYWPNILGSKSRPKTKTLNSERQYEESVGILRSRNCTFEFKLWNVAAEELRDGN
jgi:hypothetical protein